MGGGAATAGSIGVKQMGQVVRFVSSTKLSQRGHLTMSSVPFGRFSTIVQRYFRCYRNGRLERLAGRIGLGLKHVELRLLQPDLPVSILIFAQLKMIGIGIALVFQDVCAG